MLVFSLDLKQINYSYLSRYMTPLPLKSVQTSKIIETAITYSK